MSLDKLCLTIFEPVDRSLMDELGDVREDMHRRNLYKYFINLDHCQIMWHPHKFGPKGNERIGYTKLDFSPKHFKSFSELESCLRQYFPRGGYKGSLSRFEVSRIDINADLENIPTSIVLARIFKSGLRSSSFNLQKGTIYMGVNPKLRVYDKTKEISDRKYKRRILPHEQEILDSGKQLTRFELTIKRPQFSLDQLSSKEDFLLKFFRQLSFYDFEDAEQISDAGGLQLLFKFFRREKRKVLEIYKSSNPVYEQVKSRDFQHKACPPQV